MISDTSKKILIRLIDYCQYWFGTPFVWHKTQEKIIVTRKSFRNWIFTLVLSLCYTSYLISRLVIRLVFGVPEMTSFDMAELYFAGISWVALFLNQINILYHYKTHVVLVNSYFPFLYKMQDIYVPKWNRRWRNGCEELLKIVLFVAIVFPCGTTFHYLGNAWRPIFPTSLLVNYNLAYWVAYLPTGLFTLFIHLAAFSAMSLSVTIPIIPAAIMNSICKEFKPKLQNHVYRTKNIFRKPENLSKHYRCVQIIEILMNEGYCHLVMPMQLVLSYCAIIANFSLVKYWERLPLGPRSMLAMASLSIIIVWSTVLLISGTIVKKSKGILAHWKMIEWSTQHDRKYMMRFGKSCRYLKLEFGGFYYVTITKVLGFINFVLWGTMRTLMIVESNF